MSIYTVGPLLGPVIGPAIGGFATQDLNWRWIFKLVAIAAGASSAFGIPLLRETYAPVLLERRAKNRGKSGEAIYEKGVHVGRVNGEVVSTTRFLWVNLSRPLALLSGSFVCFILSCYMALFAFLISFAVFLLAKTHRFPWNRSYGWSSFRSSLAESIESCFAFFKVTCSCSL